MSTNAPARTSQTRLAKAGLLAQSAIVYDATPDPGEEALAGYAEALGLPKRNWTVIRRLNGRVVAFGAEPDWDPDHVLKVGPAHEHGPRLERAVVGERMLALAAERIAIPWLEAPDAAGWRTQIIGDTALACGPYVVGTPLAPERILTPNEALSLAAEAPTVARIITDLEKMSGVLPVPPLFDRERFAAGFIPKIGSRLRNLIDTDGLDMSEAKRVETMILERFADAPLRPVFGHGELTAWHILRVTDGRLALIDLETAGVGGPAGIDLTVYVMRTWGLNEAPAAARLAHAAYLATAETSAARKRLSAELAWQWPYAALRTRAESRAWGHRDGAADFWTWATSVRTDR